MTFEKKMQQLETIIEKIEAPQTPLEKSLELYKKGIGIAKICAETLTTYEAEVMLLEKEAENIFTLSPFSDIESECDEL